MASVALVGTHALGAQTRTFQACSQGALKNCAGIRLTSSLGAGPAGTNRFDIAIANLGSQAFPGLATSIYFATFTTGLGPVAFGPDALPTPVQVGGATLLDATPWSLLDGGDVVFLSAPGNDGIGNCTFAGAVGGFGLMAQTCGAGTYISFSFFTPRAINVNNVGIGDLEFVAISSGNTADSCNDTTPCTITSAVVTPEPASLMLLVAGLAGIAVVTARRKTAAARSSRGAFAMEG